MYSIFNTTISKTGLAMNIVYTCIGCLIVFNIFGIMFCMITNHLWYNPLGFIDGPATGYFYLVFVICPIVIGVALNTLKMQSYKLLDYLIMYFLPKIPVNQHGKRINISSYKVDTYVRSI